MLLEHIVAVTETTISHVPPCNSRQECLVLWVVGVQLVVEEVMALVEDEGDQMPGKGKAMKR